MGVTKLEKLNLEFCMRALTLTQIMPSKYPNTKKCAICLKPGALPIIVKFKKNSLFIHSENSSAELH